MSALIGFERQWHHRLAGLRTNLLVALGAASFVIFESLVPDASPTRVAAQLVSGIGFLGAGMIFRDGLSVRGLNTAALIWCSAGGWCAPRREFSRLCGTDYGLYPFVNLLLRPIVMLINNQPLMGAEIEVCDAVSVTCRSPDEAHIRALLLQDSSGLSLRRLDSNNIEGTGHVVVKALITASHRVDADVEKIVGRKFSTDSTGLNFLESGITSCPPCFVRTWYRRGC